MKVPLLLTIIFSISSTFAQEDGQYHPDDEGRYIPDYSGRYIPDNSGQYRDDGTGRYAGDGGGQYKTFVDQYRNQNQFNTRDRLGAAATIKSSFVKPNFNPLPPKHQNYDDGRWKIIRLANNVDTDGFHWEYETENDIIGEENAKVHNKGTKEEVIRTHGFYKYTGPDNVIYNVEYTADENGFIPKANHLPPALQKAIIQNLNSKKV